MHDTKSVCTVKKNLCTGKHRACIDVYTIVCKICRTRVEFGPVPANTVQVFSWNVFFSLKRGPVVVEKPQECNCDLGAAPRHMQATVGEHLCGSGALRNDMAIGPTGSAYIFIQNVCACTVVK